MELKEKKISVLKVLYSNNNEVTHLTGNEEATNGM